MDKITEQTEKLKEDILTDISVDTNRITGKISLSEPKALVLSLPYSKGFRAYVDGKETDLIQANTMYMGLMLEAGEHEIQLAYCTPFLIPGLCLTLAGLCVTLVWYFLEEIKRRYRNYERFISSASGI